MREQKLEGKEEETPTPETPEEETPETPDPPVKKKRGRPKGSKNKPKDQPQETPEEQPEEKEIKVKTKEVKPGKNGNFLSLFIDCAPIKLDDTDPGYLVNLNAYHHGLAQEVAEKLDNVDNYYEIDAFKRRDMICLGVEKIAENLRGHAVVVNSDPDITPLVNALIRYADLVVRGPR